MVQSARAWWRRITRADRETTLTPLRSTVGAPSWNPAEQPYQSPPPATSAPAPKRRRATASARQLRDVAQFFAAVRDWAPSQPELRAIAVIGPWAGADADAETAIELLVLGEDPVGLAERPEWLETFPDLGCGALIRPDGLLVLPCTHENGLEVDLIVDSVTWAAIEPVHPIARETIDFGFSILHDPDRLLAHLIRACDILAANEFR
jgi:hypothetical protein